MTTIDKAAQRQMNAANGLRHKIRLPEGATNVIDQVRLGMSGGYSGAEQASKAIGMSRDTYSFTRKLLLLKGRQVLSEADERKVDHALKVLNDDLVVATAKKIAAPILRKYWVSNTRTGDYTGELNARDRRKERTRFDNTLFAIREACTNNEELKIPFGMSRTEKEEVAHSLKDAIDALVNLKLRIMGEQT